MCVYMCIYVCVCVNIYVFTNMFNERLDNDRENLVIWIKIR